MGATQDFNRPAFGNSIDDDLDQIRNNWHFLTLVAAQGSLVIPGWQTSVTATDYAQPDQISLTRGTKSINLKYTWSGNNLSTVQFCYDDGINGEVCFDAIDVAFDADGNLLSALQPSGFDTAIEDLAPDVWYKFDDTSFGSTLTDSGTLGATLTSQNSTDASVGAAMRITRDKSLSMPAFTANNWSTEGAHYTDSAAAIGGLISGATGITIIHSFKMGTNTGVDQYLFRLGTNQTLQSNQGFRCMYIDTDNKLGCQMEHTTGRTYPDSTTTNLDDGSVHLLIYRFGVAGLKMELDGTEEDTGVWNKTAQTTAADFNIGGLNSAGDTGAAWQTDCLAIWDTYLSDAQISNLWTLYNSEIV